MNKLIKLEELSFFGFSLYLFTQLGYSWWLYAGFFLAPDLGLLGYMLGPRFGSWTYNLFHHKGIAIALYILGALIPDPVFQFAGIILFGHSSLDRVLGYGLKFPDSFQNTHLGIIGRSK